MVGDNDTSGSEFILLGFTSWEELQVMCFVFFFAIYVVTLTGNLGVIILIRLDPCLHTPMYFFLSHLSFLDICYSSTILPPIHSLAIFRLPFCGSRRINHFFCDGPPLLALSCSDTRASRRVVSALVGFNVLSTTGFILLSYSCVLSGVLRARSAAALRRAASTCASHLVSVTLYSSSALFMYLRPGSGRSSEHDKVVATLYSVAVPMLNPLIYSLRNTDVKNAMRKAKGRVLSSFSRHSSWPAERRGPSFHG
ncbi:PREDICTED: olfactory receptor 1020-like [Chaetura pelagica]|uniref:olfactory receptor 1020-like n=1 Tax=Chaetura pelagica TaxID=8897 RepID=UPI00052359B8|nr:PREDICTED: olfactory receptor 1020-like [Chaetura pelagica]